MSHHLYCAACASYNCAHTQRQTQREKVAVPETAHSPLSQIGRSLLGVITALAILAAILGSCYAYYTEGSRSINQAPLWRWTHTDYVRADWIASYTDNEHVLNTRWYRGHDCPIKRADWPYITGHLGQPTLAHGIYSTEGYICLAGFMPVSPDQPTALHELAHAVAWEEHWYAGHGTLFQDILDDVEQHYRWRR